MALVVSSSTGASTSPLKSLEDAIDDFQTILTADQRDDLASFGAVPDADAVMTFTA